MCIPRNLGTDCLPSLPGMMLATHVVLVLLGLGFHSAKAVSFNVQASSCNVPCGQKGMWSMDQHGATAKAGICYHCFATSYSTQCPSGTDHRDDGWTYDDCCNEYTCSCSSQCTQNQIGDGTCDIACNTASCGNDGRNGGSDCSSSSSGSTAPSPPPPQVCPCCSQDTPTLPETGARAEDGVCWHCYETDTGGNCPDADKRSDGWTYDHCCNKFPKTAPRVCTQRFSKEECIQRHGVNTDGLLDATGDFVGGVVDVAGNVLDAANPLSDLEAIAPDCGLEVDNCAARCTFGFRSEKSSLLVEFVLELDVQSASRGTATFEGYSNGMSLIKDSYEFHNGASDAYCVRIPGLHVGLGGLSLCLNLDPSQTGGFVITSGVFMELSIRFSVLTMDFDFPLGNDQVEWPCPNVVLNAGLSTGTVVLLALICLRCWCRRRKARLPDAVPVGIEVQRCRVGSV